VIGKRIRRSKTFFPSFEKKGRSVSLRNMTSLGLQDSCYPLNHHPFGGGSSVSLNLTAHQLATTRTESPSSLFTSHDLFEMSKDPSGNKELSRGNHGIPDLFRNQEPVVIPGEEGLTSPRPQPSDRVRDTGHNGASPPLLPL